jgi:hypothetical protein
VMKNSITVNKKQIVFFALVFIYGFLFQPRWVIDNFWLKADFYNDIPFRVPYLAFLALYAFLNTLFVWYVVKFVKKYL